MGEGLGAGGRAMSNSTATSGYLHKYIISALHQDNASESVETCSFQSALCLMRKNYSLLFVYLFAKPECFCMQQTSNEFLYFEELLRKMFSFISVLV